MVQCGNLDAGPKPGYKIGGLCSPKHMFHCDKPKTIVAADKSVFYV